MIRYPAPITGRRPRFALVGCGRISANHFAAFERLRDRGSVYHLAASGAVTRRRFAEAIIRAMSEAAGKSEGWATVRSIATTEYPPLPARRPPKPVMGQNRIRLVFGITMRNWKEQVRAFLADHVREDVRRPT